MNSKAQGNTFWIIVAAVIALVVLVVLLAIFTGKITDLGGGLTDCESKQGVCYSISDGCPEGMTKTSVFACSEKMKKANKPVCCLGTKK